GGGDRLVDAVVESRHAAVQRCPRVVAGRQFGRRRQGRIGDRVVDLAAIDRGVVDLGLGRIAEHHRGGVGRGHHVGGSGGLIGSYGNRRRVGAGHALAAGAGGEREAQQGRCDGAGEATAHWFKFTGGRKSVRANQPAKASDGASRYAARSSDRPSGSPSRATPPAQRP